ncbi:MULTISPECIES: type II secretion system minor pseudopilin GspI [unclassified Agarivorans]|uniref:type II secretion system minor pseudopilin GspI n=1 Tax=unclassified Agarivorans TaxID=2636026 RepID=UPI0010DA10FA|nr:MULTISPECIES: type II secretion system minor pseudopilin GspI [unclassified Agarivorans]MDO6687533.1 type II secretion system minor pseudopilin GspI [Agarivorans sp. 3_MG-2023]MDO6717134.1 type II secretion system minor pseudopilin GspI [Agarivorans sp. 2_MG-2023]MDO6765741.1 type II secretion system minor pseudopilin GspI [Agarivorans sp. 1_MG-2023]GDY27720.1 type II secretion system protein GspI [Agarivorans sp. Toyoura001]
MNKQRGMTLLEVMVALAVLAIAGTAVMKSASENLRSLSYIQEKTFALWIADNQMAELKLSNTWPGTSSRKGTTTFADTEWQWRSQGVATSDPNFVAVTISVYRNAEEKAALAEITSYVSR